MLNSLSKKLLIIFIYGGILFSPIFCLAASESGNYQTESLVDYGGGYSESENYQVVDTIGNSDVITESQATSTPTPGGTTSSPVPTITSTPTAMPEVIEEIEIIPEKESGFKAIIGAFVKNPVVKALQTPLNIAVGALVLGTILLPLLMNLPLASPLASLFGVFVGWFGRRKKPWGRVYDSQTNQGVPIVAVQLFDKQFNRLIKTELTDNEGRFGFLVKPGEYYLKIVKKGYSFPSTKIRRGYRGQSILVKANEPIIVDIPVDVDMQVLTHRLGALGNFSNIISSLRLPILILGTIIAIGFVVYYGRVWDIVIVSMYGLIWIWEIYRLTRSKAYGRVADSSTDEAINLSIVRVFNQLTNKLVATQVSDSNGRYKFLVNPGDYYMESAKTGYLDYKSKEIVIKSNSLLTKDIYLQSKQHNLQVQKPVALEPTLLDLAQAN